MKKLLLPLLGFSFAVLALSGCADAGGSAPDDTPTADELNLSSTERTSILNDCRDAAVRDIWFGDPQYFEQFYTLETATITLEDQEYMVQIFADAGSGSALPSETSPSTVFCRHGGDYQVAAIGHRPFP